MKVSVLFLILITACVVHSQYYYYPYNYYYSNYYYNSYYYPQYYPYGFQYYFQLPFGIIQTTTTSSPISYKLPYPYSLAEIKVEGSGFSPVALGGAAAGALLGFLAGK